MESDGDEGNDIFDNDATEGNEERSVENTAESAGVRVAPPKRVVKNPRLKFNPERLCGERGIPVLVDHFKNVKFKGKGHEVEDLDKLMANLEHWTHRLFPSMKFEECLRHIEKLGKKRPVQTCLTKIRLDMPILNSDFVQDDDEEDNVKRNDDPDDVDPFDRLISESQEGFEPNNSSENMSAFPISSNSLDNVPANVAPPAGSSSNGQLLGSSFGLSLTEEQKKRMEYNRMLAAERRKAKLAALEINAPDCANNPTQSSQDVVSAFDEIVTSSTANAASSNINVEKEVIADDSFVKQNENSENLELDDLMNFVDEEEPDEQDSLQQPQNIQNNESISVNNHLDFHSKSQLALDGQKSSNNEIEVMDFSESSEVRSDSNKMDLTPLAMKSGVADQDKNSSQKENITVMNYSNTYLEMDSTLKMIPKDKMVPEISKYPHSVDLSEKTLNVSSECKNIEIEAPSQNEASENAKDELLALEEMIDLVEEE